jgi:hypothetical protein
MPRCLMHHPLQFLNRMRNENDEVVSPGCTCLPNCMRLSSPQSKNNRHKVDSPREQPEFNGEIVVKFDQPIHTGLGYVWVTGAAKCSLELL